MKYVWVFLRCYSSISYVFCLALAPVNPDLSAIFLFSPVFLVSLKNSEAISHVTPPPANHLEETVSSAECVPVRMPQK